MSGILVEDDVQRLREGRPVSEVAHNLGDYPFRHTHTDTLGRVLNLVDKKISPADLS